MTKLFLRLRFAIPSIFILFVVGLAPNVRVLLELKTSIKFEKEFSKVVETVVLQNTTIWEGQTPPQLPPYSSTLHFRPFKNGSSWILPTTVFTPHILGLADYVRQNMTLQKIASCRQTRVRPIPTIAFYVPFSDSLPLVSTPNKTSIGYDYLRALKKHVFYPTSQNILPQGKLTIAFSPRDRDELESVCTFASSSPNGHHAVFNFQDIRRWAYHQSYPPSLPWEERKSIPIFRGSGWGSDHQYVKNQLQSELKRNIQNGMDVESAGKIFFDHFLEHEMEPLKRCSLVYFSYLHPDLINAKFHGPKHMTSGVWENNATNGMYRLLPFDWIEEYRYYTEYQVHVVMGGYGAAFRLARVLKQEVAVILQDYPYEEWFTHLMKPFVHYIPLNTDLSNLNETLHWVRDNPSEVYKIAKNGRIFYEEYLSYERMAQFYYELIFRLMLCCASTANSTSV